MACVPAALSERLRLEREQQHPPTRTLSQSVSDGPAASVSRVGASFNSLALAQIRRLLLVSLILLTFPLNHHLFVNTPRRRPSTLDILDTRHTAHGPVVSLTLHSLTSTFCGYHLPTASFCLVARATIRPRLARCTPQRRTASPPAPQTTALWTHTAVPASRPCSPTNRPAPSTPRRQTAARPSQSRSGTLLTLNRQSLQHRTPAALHTPRQQLHHRVRTICQPRPQSTSARCSSRASARRGSLGPTRPSMRCETTSGTTGPSRGRSPNPSRRPT